MTYRTQPTDSNIQDTAPSVPQAPHHTQYAIRSTQCVLRLGSTSAVYPDDVLPNVRKLAGKVADIEWVVFEVTYGLPGPEVIAEMARLGAGHGHSYTVHLPLGLALTAEDEGLRQAAVVTAGRVIALADALAPWAYIVHLEGEGSAPAWSGWHERAAASLAALGKAAGGLERLAVENLPEYPAEHLCPLLERLPVSVCLDVGHALTQGTDPRLLLAQQAERVRVVHLHGREGGRDHRSLRALDGRLLHDLLLALRRADYAGVVTIELFDARALWESREIVEEVWRVVTEGKRGNEGT